jgi:chromate transporter
MPQVGPFILGIRSAMIAVILAAVYRLSKPMMKNPFMVLIGLAVMGLNILHADEVVLLLGAGVLGIIWENRHRLRGAVSSFFVLAVTSSVPLAQVSTSIAVGAGGATLTGLGLFFLKVGSVLYGSGYVLVAFLQGGLVDARHWLTQTQLLDAIAIGQFTPVQFCQRRRSSDTSFLGFLAQLSPRPPFSFHPSFSF